MRCLQANQVGCHPFILGELACGTLAQREVFLSLLGNLPQSRLASHYKVMQFIQAQQLIGLGIGYVECHLLASAKLSGGTSLWTRDKRLKTAAITLELAFLEQ